jgi:hypothetical protein
LGLEYLGISGLITIDIGGPEEDRKLPNVSLAWIAARLHLFKG